MTYFQNGNNCHIPGVRKKVMTDELQNIQPLFIQDAARGITEYVDASDRDRDTIEDMARVITSENADEDDKAMARHTLTEWLWPQPAIDLETGEQIREHIG